MKVCFVGINSAYSHSMLSIYYLYNNCLSNEMNGKIKEYNINMPLNETISDLYEEKSDVYVFSCYIWNIEYVLKVISSIRKILKCKIILGGSEVSYNAKDYVNVCDYVVSGEGEKTLKELLMCINENKKVDLDNVFNINSTNFNIVPKTLDFNEVIFPYKNIPMDRFKNKIVYYESSRGCPFNCTYCLSHLDKTIRYRDIEMVKEELMYFISQDVPLVKFVDRTFNANLKRTKEIVKFILENSRNTKFHFEICANILDDELIDLLTSRYDLFQSEIGLQSTNKNTLKAINRINDFEKIKENINKLLKKDTIHVHLDLIAGLPYEDLESFENSYNYAYNLNPHMLQLGFLKVLHGTVMEERANQYNLQYNNFTPYEVLSNDYLSFEDISLLKGIEYLTDKYYNSSSFINTLKYAIKYLNISPFDFYKELSFFFKDKNKTSNNSKENLYSFLYEFLLKKGIPHIAEIIAFDYLKYYRMRITKQDFFDSISIENKESVFDMIKENKFDLSYYEGLSTKKIYKHIIVTNFNFNPITFKDEDIKIVFYDELEDKIRGGRKISIIQ